MTILTTAAYNGITQFITVLILFILVLGVTWAVTKWLAGYQKGRWSGGNIEMLESIRIASDKYVQIIRVGNKYLAVAVAKDTVTFLTEVDESALMRKDDTADAKMSFRELLEKVREKKKE